MKKPGILKIYPLLLLGIIFLGVSSCEKEDDNNGGEEAGTFTDARDGNVYQTVSIGDQVWMAEELKYLPSVTGPQSLSNVSPNYYVYDYFGTVVSEAKATENYQTYGVLYNWPAAIDACPPGWRLPADEDWSELTDFLGGANTCAYKLKTSGTAENETGLWASPNTEANNESGFSALPGGHVYIFRDDGSFVHLGNYGYWWSASFTDTDEAWYRRMDYNRQIVFNNLSPKRWGYSVRCVKN